MNSLDAHGCIFLSTSLISLIHFESLIHLWRRILVYLSGIYALKRVGNMWISLLDIFSLSMVHIINSHFLKPLSRMGLLKQRIEYYGRWPIVWYSLEIWVLLFGLRLLIVPAIFKIKCLTRHCDIWLLRGLGLMSIPMFLHFIFLVGRLGYLF